MQSAWKVGLLVMLFVAMLMGAFAVLQKSAFARKTNVYYAEFADAGGITAGSKVLLSGVVIGQVGKVKLDSPGKAVVELQIQSQYQIPKNSIASLPSSLIGIADREVQIVPPAKWDGLYLEPGQKIAGTKASPLKNMFPESEQLIKDLQATLASFRKLIEDEDLKDSLKGLIASAKDTSDRFGQLATRMDGVVASNQGRLAALFKSVGGSLEDIKVITAELRRVAESGEMEDKALALMDKLNKAVEQGNLLVSDLRSAVNDPAMRANLDSTLANFKTMSESGTRIASDSEKIAKNGVTLSEKAINLADKANALADDVKELLDRFKSAIERVGAGSRFPPKITAEAELVRETKPNKWRTDIMLSAPFREQTVYFGLYDAFESNKINLQLGRDYWPNTHLRYGIYASKPGIGVDWRLTPDFLIKGNLYGVNHPRFDARAQIHFGKGISGWFGMDQILKANRPSIGVGIKR